MKNKLIILVCFLLALIDANSIRAESGRATRVYTPRPLNTKLLNTEDAEESPWYLFLGVDLGFSTYSPYQNSATETSRSGLHAGVRALIAHYSESWVIDGGLGWQKISNSGTNADGSKNTDDSSGGYLDLSPRYRLGNTNFQIGPELEYWISTDKGLNPTIGKTDTISSVDNTSMWLGLQGLWEWTTNNKYRLGARFLHGINVDSRSVNVIQAFFQIGFDVFSSNNDDQDRKRNKEQVNETDLNEAERYQPRTPLPMATPAPTPEAELNPDPVVMSTPAPPEAEPTPEPVEVTPSKVPPKVIFTLDVNDLPFGFDNATLPKSNSARVKNMGTFLAKHDENWKKLIISGHTDERGTKAYNLKLSKRRADAVKTLLISGGAKAQKITAVGLGGTKPKDRHHNEKAWSRNRRVELEFKGVKDLTIMKKAMSQ